MKRICLIALILLFCGAMSCGSKQKNGNTQGNNLRQQGFVYVGSAKSNVYHFPKCIAAQRISPKNLVGFSSATDAQARGYHPCKICKPPLQDQ